MRFDRGVRSNGNRVGSRSRSKYDINAKIRAGIPGPRHRAGNLHSTGRLSVPRGTNASARLFRLQRSHPPHLFEDRRRPAVALRASFFARGRGTRSRLASLCARAQQRQVKRARHWEIRYGVGAASSYAILGFWCFFAITGSTDPFVHLVSFTATTAYVVGITGRNFGTSRLVVAQILSVAVPMIAGLLRVGEPFHLAFALLLAMFFVAVAFVCERLRHSRADSAFDRHNLRYRRERSGDQRQHRRCARAARRHHCR